MWEKIEIWGFLAGLGMFLFGMHMLEQGLRGLGTQSFKRFLRAQTHSPVRGVLTGTVATAFLQSSSLVGLIVLAFVGAGILELRNALGIIFGSNLGTTFTGWIVTTIGFKLDLAEFSQPLLAMGAIGTVFTRPNHKPYYLSNLLLGLGLLLLGLEAMKGSFDILAETADVSIFKGHNLLVYLLAGAAFTAVIQSSSATMMILLSALHAEVISIQAAAAIVVGADLGTTSTVLLGALKGTAEKKRVAFAHFFFNLFTDIIAFLSIIPLLYFVTNIIGITDSLYALVSFHSIFNLIGIIIFLPLVNRFEKFLRWLVSDDREGTTVHCHYIHNVPSNITDLAIESVHKELEKIILRVIKLNLRCFKIKAGEVFTTTSEKDKGEKHSSYDETYAEIKAYSGEIMSYTYLVQKNAQDVEDAETLTQLNHAIRNVSYSAKHIKDIRHNMLELRHSRLDAVIAEHRLFKKAIKAIYRHLVALSIDMNTEVATEKLTALKSEVETVYAEYQKEFYSITEQQHLDAAKISTLLNLNRAVYLSNCALIEAFRVMLNIDERMLNVTIPVTVE